MSAQEGTNGTDNATAVEDVNAVLAELEADDQARQHQTDPSLKPESNGADVAKPGTETSNGESRDNDDKAGVDEALKQKRKRDDEDMNRERYDRRRDDNRGRGRGGRGGGRGGFKPHRDNIKSNVIREEKSDDPVAIRKQVEFYFSDSNLPMDQFLLGKVNGSENLPVEIDVIRSFKRMRHFEPLEAIVAALKESKLVDVVENDTKIQRKEPLPKEVDEWLEGRGKDLQHVRVFEDKAMPRTVYVKGFGQEVPSTQFDIEAFFAQHGPTNAIRLRRADDKVFKGSVFAEFESEELAHSFVALDPKPKFQDRELKIMMKKDYCQGKADDIAAGRIRASTDRPRRGHGGRGGRHNNDRKGRPRDDDRDWRTRRDEDRKNGFRDDKRREHKRSRSDVEKDVRGIPVVQSSGDDERAQAKAEAIAQAKAAVENDKGDAEEEAGKKRGREEENETTDEPATKKIDVKGDA